jgi:Raf kinase inhibitor-like YbhB/YbcL family protein
MAMRITSSAFAPGGAIPAKYTRDGENVSPEIRWENSPAQTKQFALICEDPDAPRPEPWVHWVAYAIPADAAGLPEKIPQGPKPRAPIAILQGVTTYETIGYDGPEPPKGHGVHHYHFKLYALDKALELDPKLDNKSLIAAMKGHIIETAEVIGTYERK